jgi:hypothetical protein
MLLCRDRCLTNLDQIAREVFWRRLSQTFDIVQACVVQPPVQW